MDCDLLVCCGNYHYFDINWNGPICLDDKNKRIEQYSVCKNWKWDGYQKKDRMIK